MPDMHALCQAAATGAKSINDFASFKAWRKRYWKPILRLHTTTYGPVRDIRRKPKPVTVRNWDLPGWHFYDGHNKPGYWLSPQGFWYPGTRDGLKGLTNNER